MTGVHGMADIIRRASPPDVSNFDIIVWPTVETIDIALFGTVCGVFLAVPFAVMAARNVTHRIISMLSPAPSSRSRAPCPI